MSSRLRKWPLARQSAVAVSGGAAVRFPHIGHVVLHDDVDIGAGTCVDRGAIGSTVAAGLLRNGSNSHDPLWLIQGDARGSCASMCIG